MKWLCQVLAKFSPVDTDNRLTGEKKYRYLHYALDGKLDIGRFAQNASNNQGISYIVVEDTEKLKKATEATNQWMEENSRFTS